MINFRELYCECDDRCWVLLPGVLSVRCPMCGVIFVRTPESSLRVYDVRGHFFDHAQRKANKKIKIPSAMSDPVDEMLPRSNEIDGGDTAEAADILDDADLPV